MRIGEWNMWWSLFNGHIILHSLSNDALNIGSIVSNSIYSKGVRIDQHYPINFNLAIKFIRSCKHSHMMGYVGPCTFAADEDLIKVSMVSKPSLMQTEPDMHPHLGSGSINKSSASQHPNPPYRYEDLRLLLKFSIWGDLARSFFFCLGRFDKIF